MDEPQRDFLETLPVKQSDIEAFAKEGVGLPDGFEELYLKRCNSVFIINRYEGGEIYYDILMVNNGEGKKIGWIGLNRSKVNINGEEIKDCWARNIKIFNDKKTSYGQMGFTRAVIKTLMQEMKRMNIKNVSAEVEQNNINSLKMGKAVGWKEPVAEYVTHRRPVYLFCAPVNEIVDFLEEKTTKFYEQQNTIDGTKAPYKPVKDLSKVDFSTLKLYQAKKMANFL